MMVAAMRKILSLLFLFAGISEAAEMKITVAGDANAVVVIDLLEDVAPLHVERMTNLANKGKYDNVVFHRVIDGPGTNWRC